MEVEAGGVAAVLAQLQNAEVDGDVLYQRVQDEIEIQQREITVGLNMIGESAVDIAAQSLK